MQLRKTLLCIVVLITLCGQCTQSWSAAKLMRKILDPRNKRLRIAEPIPSVTEASFVSKKSKLKSCLYEILQKVFSGASFELIDIIIAYEPYELEGNLLRTCSGHVGSIDRIEELGSLRFISSSNEGEIGIWDASTGKNLQVIREAHRKRSVIILAVLSKSEFASGSNFDKVITIWSPKTETTWARAQDLEIDDSMGVFALKTLTDNKLAAAIEVKGSLEKNGSKIILWNTKTRKKVCDRVVPSTITEFVTLPDGGDLVSWDGHVITFWDKNTLVCKRVFLIELQRPLKFGFLSRELTNASNHAFICCNSESVCIVDFETGKHNPAFERSGLCAIAILQDGKIALALPTQVLLYDTMTRTYSVFSASLETMALGVLSDGKLVVGSRNGKITIWT